MKWPTLTKKEKEATKKDPYNQLTVAKLKIELEALDVLEIPKGKRKADLVAMLRLLLGSQDGDANADDEASGSASPKKKQKKTKTSKKTKKSGGKKKKAAADDEEEAEAEAEVAEEEEEAASPAKKGKKGKKASKKATPKAKKSGGRKKKAKTPTPEPEPEAEPEAMDAAPTEEAPKATKAKKGKKGGKKASTAEAEPEPMDAAPTAAEVKRAKKAEAAAAKEAAKAAKAEAAAKKAAKAEKKKRKAAKAKADAEAKAAMDALRAEMAAGPSGGPVGHVARRATKAELAAAGDDSDDDELDWSPSSGGSGGGNKNVFVPTIKAAIDLGSASGGGSASSSSGSSAPDLFGLRRMEAKAAPAVVALRKRAAGEASGSDDGEDDGSDSGAERRVYKAKLMDARIAFNQQPMVPYMGAPLPPTVAFPGGQVAQAWAGGPPPNAGGVGSAAVIPAHLGYNHRRVMRGRTSHTKSAWQQVFDAEMRKNSEKEREALAKRRRGEIDAEDAADGGAGAPPSGVPDPKRLKVTPAVFQAMVAAEEKERRTVEKATARKNRYWKERAEKNRQIREGRHDNDKNTPGEGRCYNCGKVGHYSRECPAPKRPKGPAAGSCFNCGQPGHHQVNCPLPRKSRGGGGK